MINHRESFPKCRGVEVCINRLIITVRGANSRLERRRNRFRVAPWLYGGVRA